MKKLTTLSIIIFQTIILNGQVPKYVLMEHFTNTLCGVCGSVNPTFYQNIDINANTKTHHMSIHSSVPYSNCIFYKANQAEQDTRASFYNIFGTPRVSINGTTPTSASNISSTTIDNSYCTDCSPLEVKVTETSGTNRTATVELKSVGTPPSGTYRIYVALVEKIVNYNAPNSETVHHNVFRRFLTSFNGDAVALASQGNSVNLNYPYTVNAAWTPSEVYVVAWVQSEINNVVLNSGTKFDLSSLPVELVEWAGKIEKQVNVLNWATATESNSSHFDIERADDSQKFITIGRIKAAGESAQKQVYTFTDLSPLPLSYYRLKQVDLDNQTIFSSIISLKRQKENFKINNLYPSITKDKLTIEVTIPEIKTIDLSIINILGYKVWSKTLNNVVGNLIEPIDVETLNSGIYFLHIQNEETVLTRRFIKN
jgi:Outer membrane protein Omp28/Secretion system C-terminal sorting domain